MVNSRTSDVALPTNSTTPVVKRKRRASCLGEQERRERKRAIDREAQRSLREKTKTHIAELERTIEILRDQDRNGATASLLSEIESLRAENERLRDVIDSVKNVIGGDIVARGNVSPDDSAADGGGAVISPAATSVGHRSPRPQTTSFAHDTKPSLPTPPDLPDAFNYHERIASNRLLDLDGMTVLSDMNAATVPAPNLRMSLTLESEEVFPVEAAEETYNEVLEWVDSPATASWGPLMAEIFGPGWRCPSPIVLHLGNPESSISSLLPNTICPVWKKSNELFGKVLSCRAASGTSVPFLTNIEALEAGLLYQGIKQGWETISNAWIQSPALMILKEVDDLLFCHLPRIERLAVAYKSFKLLKYYLNATKDELEKVPTWLRPSPTQARTYHPIAIDFFAWPTLRDRLVSNHSSIFRTGDLSKCYSSYLRFDWPFAFEDAFFLDEATGACYPNPLFERYHRDMRYWTVGDKFYETFPEMRGDIEGDRRRFCEA